MNVLSTYDISKSDNTHNDKEYFNKELYVKLLERTIERNNNDTGIIHCKCVDSNVCTFVLNTIFDETVEKIKSVFIKDDSSVYDNSEYPLKSNVEIDSRPFYIR